MFNSVKDYRKFVIEWNNNFPLDKWYREKYHIAFGSEQHKNTCQLDIYFEWLEENIFNEHQQEYQEMQKKKELLDKGIWISQEPEITDEMNDDLFDKIDIDSINNFGDGAIKIED